MSDDDDRLLDVAATLRNVILILQEHPERYKLFGVWWWAIKALLRGAGYGRETLAYLGDYQDPETAGLVPPAGLQETLRAALLEYGQNIRYPRAGGVVESPDGELVTIYDPDAGR